jgi:hypothetical protein
MIIEEDILINNDTTDGFDDEEEELMATGSGEKTPQILQIKQSEGLFRIN